MKLAAESIAQVAQTHAARVFCLVVASYPSKQFVSEVPLDPIANNPNFMSCGAIIAKTPSVNAFSLLLVTPLP